MAGFRIPVMLNENGDALLEGIRLLSLMLEIPCCAHVNVPNEFAHVGERKVLVYAESAHCDGNFANKYPLEGNIKVGTTLKLYVDNVDIVNTFGIPVHVITVGYTIVAVVATV